MTVDDFALASLISMGYEQLELIFIGLGISAAFEVAEGRLVLSFAETFS